MGDIWYRYDTKRYLNLYALPFSVPVCLVPVLLAHQRLPVT